MSDKIVVIIQRYVCGRNIFHILALPSNVIKKESTLEIYLRDSTVCLHPQEQVAEKFSILFKVFTMTL